MSLYDYENCDRCVMPVNMPDNVDFSCSVNSIRQAFLEIINAVKTTDGLDFNVDIEITTKNGISKTVNFSKLMINNIILTETTLIANDIAFSLCDVVKVNIISSPFLGTAFPAMILNALKDITTTPYYQDKEYYSNCSFCNDNKSSTDIKCAQEMQDYINKNSGSIQTVGYTGSFPKVQDITAVENISTTDVVENASISLVITPVINSVSLDNQTVPVVDSATVSSKTVPVIDSANLDTQTSSVIKTISIPETDLVSDVNLNNISLVSQVTPTTIEVSAPLNTVPTSVVSEVSLTTENDIVTNIQTTPQQVITEVTPTNGLVVTSVPDAANIEGVISGVTTPSAVTPETYNIPSLTSTGTGLLTVTIAAKSIDGTNPQRDITLNVKSGNQDINFGGNTEKYVLGNQTNLIGYTAGTPAASTVKQTGTPTTASFVQSISTQNEQVIKTVTPQNTTGKLVDTVSKVNINNVNNPEIKTVVESINSTSQNVNTVLAVDKSALNDLLKTTTEDVVSSATLNTTTENVVSSTTLNLTTENVVSSSSLTTTNQNVVESASTILDKTNVINGLQETTVTVVSPVEEQINGRIFTAGDGIMAVNNTNGDISLYSICDINTVTR